METRGVVLDVAEENRVEVKITALPSDFKVIRAVLFCTEFDSTQLRRCTSQEYMAIDNRHKLCAALKKEENAEALVK
ncbi:hypothetical protein KIN20_015212 [Parelaphostrongylus tenuis]|uniref:Uncharacterized protein n=1 Tax=Parelaphostrongylus tenuis TaxID=148309 RepID=A0AAD5QNU1_PARTN|nr:hypothetical protein KIN20_015212 [Parelaphostrongylus tenuis]